MNERQFDIVITGGGLAGLALSIQLARRNYRVCLCEKENYPFHRVCGEYISMESWSFLKSLGLDLDAMNLPQIRNLLVSAPDGRNLSATLPLGGFGISRYQLDHQLAILAREAGVDLREGCKVHDIKFQENHFITYTSDGELISRFAAGSFGKRSNLDIKWGRKFILQKKGALQNYVGIKYHAKSSHPIDRISLHNFQGGYLGISAIEKGLTNCCYLTTANNLKMNSGDIQRMEENVLMQNPYIRNFFGEADFIHSEPVSISQISFKRKTLIENHVWLLGDAAGMITPLCGNGMSMALHSSKMAAFWIHEFLSGKMDRSAAEYQYAKEWENRFSTRLKTGRILQSFFGNSQLSNLALWSLKPFPGMVRRLVQLTHGSPF
jgi:menaquinone-9 beta-reductase